MSTISLIEFIVVWIFIIALWVNSFRHEIIMRDIIEWMKDLEKAIDDGRKIHGRW